MNIIYVIAKMIYWTIFGWWLEPIKFFKKRKREKMENELLKYEYQKMQKEKMEE